MFFSGEGRYVVSVLRRLGYAAALHEIPRIDALMTLTCDFEANWARFCDRRFDRDVRRLIAAQAADPAAGTALAARLNREIRPVARELVGRSTEGSRLTPGDES
jgi:hypothetical protein